MKKNPKNYDVLIIGAGPAGANAAISYKNLNPNLTVAGGILLLFFTNAQSNKD